MDITLVKRIYDKMYVDEEEIPLPEGFQGVQDIDCLIFIRLVEGNSRSTRLAQFMLFLSQSKEKGINKSTVWKCKARESAVDIYSLIKKDHQEIAGLFRRLKAAEGFSETSEQLFAQLREELELHAHAEERVWYPALREAEGTQELVEEALDDHELVQDLLDELAASRMDDAAWSEKLEVLEEYVEDHIEEEESDIFDVALQLFSAEQAAELAQHWQIAKQEHMARHAK